MVRVLVTGANGQLGQTLRRVAGTHPKCDIRFFGAADLDITDTAAIDRAFGGFRPDFCINTAAYTAVDAAEDEPEKAGAVNTSGALKMAEACRRHDAVLVHLSTDFVFDGTKGAPYNESDAENPVNVYGATKHEGEKAVRQAWRKHFIIRTSWIYSDFGHNFFKTMLRLGSERPSLTVVDDQIGSPTLSFDLAAALFSIIDLTVRMPQEDRFGTYHFCNGGAVSWFGFAQRIFEYAELHPELKPIKSQDYPAKAARPGFSVLDTAKFRATFGIGIRPWEAALSDLISKRDADPNLKTKL